MTAPRHDYAAILRQRARDAAEARDAASPLSLTAYRAEQARDAWRAEYARTGGRDARDLFNNRDGRP